MSNQIRTQKLPEYQRFLFRQIDFSQRLIDIMGARGAGKTTLLLQYLKSVARETKVLYVIADHPLQIFGVVTGGGFVALVGAKSSGVSIISKPEKLYLDNTNLFAVFCNQPKAGTVRETFFASMLSYHHTLNYPKSGDFLVDGQDEAPS